jgi:hypothetical protein
MSQNALQQTRTSRDRNTIGQQNGASILNAFRKQAVVQLAIKKIRDVLNFFANNTSTSVGSHLSYYVDKGELFMDGAGI